jgi:hypothetical protein
MGSGRGHYRLPTRHLADSSELDGIADLRMWIGKPPTRSRQVGGLGEKKEFLYAKADCDVILQPQFIPK